MTIRQIEGDTRRPSKEMAHRLADVLAISADERAAFVGFARRSPVSPAELSPANAPSTASPNLPLQPTPFVGRVDELIQIAERLALPACRLLTLVGTGGAGKTRLALRAASEIASRFTDGVCFVSLASVGSPGLIAPGIASALKLS